mmetsp:Transcript_32116/g.102364  ORF Transcript_32116/g.102364 Transcript_32116/m.102364 type:complete len:236 (-) Transcript_32116:423-1130(-)
MMTATAMSSSSAASASPRYGLVAIKSASPADEMSRQKRNSGETHACSSATCRRPKTCRSNASPSAAPSSGTAAVRRSSIGSPSRTAASSRSRSSERSLIRPRTAAAAASSLAPPPPASSTSSASSRKVQRGTAEPFSFAAKASASAARRPSISTATLERASGWLDTSKPRVADTSEWPSRERETRSTKRSRPSACSGALQKWRVSSAVLDGGNSCRVNGSRGGRFSRRAARSSSW